jgi:hypothetical protein
MAGARLQFRFGPGCAGHPGGEAEPRPHFSRLRHSSGGLRTPVLGPDDVDEAAEKATEVRMIEEAATAKAIEEALAAKMAADEAAVAKVVEEAVVKMVTDEATTKIADHEAAWVKATMKSAGSDSSPAPAVGTKRAAAP